jgi:uncharacterized damage-inducible protein DinB
MRATGRQATHALQIKAIPHQEFAGNVSQERRACFTIVLVEGIIMQPEDDELAALFLKFSHEKLIGQFWPRLRTAVEPLTEEQVWWRPNEASNSIGNLILHLNGNVRQWLVDSFNGTNDGRDRPAEFATTGGHSAAELLARIGATLDQAAAVLGRLTREELLAPYTIQGYRVRGLDAVYQVVEHFGFHYGQIIYIAKSLTDKDLGFYKDLSKTGRVD